MGKDGIKLPHDCGLSTMGRDHRVAVPVHVARSLSWLKKAEVPIDCLVVVAEPGRITVLPEAVARENELVAELIADSRGPDTDLASALLTSDTPEIVRRLRVTSASIDHPSSAYRLHLSKTLFPLLDLDLPHGERGLYLYKVGDYLQVASVAFTRQGFRNAPLTF